MPGNWKNILIRTGLQKGTWLGTVFIVAKSEKPREGDVVFWWIKEVIKA